MLPKHTPSIPQNMLELICEQAKKFVRIGCLKYENIIV
jgi:hypothetical protein